MNIQSMSRRRIVGTGVQHRVYYVVVIVCVPMCVLYDNRESGCLGMFQSGCCARGLLDTDGMSGFVLTTGGVFVG